MSLFHRLQANSYAHKGPVLNEFKSYSQNRVTFNEKGDSLRFRVSKSIINIRKQKFYTLRTRVKRCLER